MREKFLERLRADFTQFEFVCDHSFHWNLEKNSIFYTEDQDFEAKILHELGHALCGHRNFEKDIDLLKMELEAWEQAKIVAQHYGVKIPQDLIEDHLDTYRDWLHKRSLCPNCQINGFQMKNGDYKCVNCQQIWHNNDAKFTELRRYKK
ncbi:MAG: hypothetical protein Q4A21_00600 [bacterium]|nr:hypothetical protein [bacterium]